MTNVQIAMTNQCPMPNGESPNWSFVIGCWSLIGHWYLVIGTSAYYAAIVIDTGRLHGPNWPFVFAHRPQYVATFLLSSAANATPIGFFEKIPHGRASSASPPAASATFTRSSSISAPNGLAR